jgi:hypothetical protein
MSILKKAGLALAATMMTVGSTAAVAAQPVRADAGVKDGFALGEAGAGWILGLVVVAALVGGFLFAGSETDAPISP